MFVFYCVVSNSFCTVRYVCSFLKDQIFVDLVNFKFLSMIIYEVLHTLSWCLRYTICSAWFLRIVSVWTSVYVFVCVCMCAAALRLLITSDMIWHDMEICDWLNKLYSHCMATVVIIVNRQGLGVGMHCRH